MPDIVQNGDQILYFDSDPKSPTYGQIIRVEDRKTAASYDPNGEPNLGPPESLATDPMLAQRDEMMRRREEFRQLRMRDEIMRKFEFNRMLQRRDELMRRREEIRRNKK